MRHTRNIFDVDKNNSDKKQLFIDAAICSLANHGYKGTTVRKIAKYAGVTPGLLTHYYQGKEVLIAESYKYLANRFLDDFKAKIDTRKTDPLKALDLFFKNIFEPDKIGPKYLRVWLAFWTLTLTEPELRDVHKEIQHQYVSSMEKMIIQANKLSGLSSNLIEIKAQATGIYALLDGLWLEACLDPQGYTPKQNLEIIYDFVEGRTGLKINPN